MIEDINDYIKNHPSNFEIDIIEGIMEKYNLTEVVATQHYNEYKKALSPSGDEYNWYGDVS